MEQRRKRIFFKQITMKIIWGGEGAESTEELDWETHTEGEI
jgi:hypothetical protein